MTSPALTRPLPSRAVLVLEAAKVAYYRQWAFETCDPVQAARRALFADLSQLRIEASFR